MAHNNKLDRKFIKKMRRHYDVNPQPEFIPALKSDLMDRFSAQQRTVAKHKPRRVALALVGTFLALMIVFFATPVYDVLGQIFVDLFPKAESNMLPNYPYQTSVAETAMAEQNPTETPAPTDINSTATERPVEPTRTPDPASREFANLNIEEVEEVAGFDVLVPALLPHAQPYYGAPVDPETNQVFPLPDRPTVLFPADSPVAVEFYGATYDPETNIAYLWYRGYLIKQEQITSMDDCDLCTIVGATPRHTVVQIGDINGKFVTGVWELRDDGMFWKSTPWVKRLRWESDNTVFEIGYFGPPDPKTMDILVGVAESFE